MANSNLLILIPHPDDEVVGCTAGLLRAQEQGKKVFGFYLTTGIYLQNRYEKKVGRRRTEAEKVARLLNIAIVSFENIPSRRFKENFFAVREKILRVLEEKKIGEVWTPAYEGGHQDHDCANFLASTLPVPAWEFSEYHFFLGKSHRNRFFASNGTELRFELTPQEKSIKKQALALYRSEWFNLKVVAPSLTQEVFRPLPPYDYTKPPYVGKMYYQRFQKFSFHPKVDDIQPETLCQVFCRYMTALLGGGTL